MERERCADIVLEHREGQPPEVVALLTRIANLIMSGE